IVLIVLGIGTLFAGFRQGLITALGTAAGFVAGWIVGRLLSPLVESLSEGTAAMENPGVLMLLASMPLVLSVLFAFAGSGIGAWIKRSMDSDLGQGIDAIGGTITAGIVYVLVVWLAAGFIRTTPLVEPNRWVADSTVIAAIDRTIPYSSHAARGGPAEGLNATGCPQVFSGQPAQLRGVGEPDAAIMDDDRGVADREGEATPTATASPAATDSPPPTPTSWPHPRAWPSRSPVGDGPIPPRWSNSTPRPMWPFSGCPNSSLPPSTSATVWVPVTPPWSSASPPTAP